MTWFCKILPHKKRYVARKIRKWSYDDVDTYLRWVCDRCRKAGQLKKKGPWDIKFGALVLDEKDWANLE